MPVRFRCAYCNQLMGISRRKVGTVVKCPTCAGQVVVPGNADEPEEPATAPQGPGGLFERADFEQKLAASAPMTTPAPGAYAPVPLGRHGHIDVEPMRRPVEFPEPDAPPGFFLTPGKLTVLAVVLLVLLGLAFFAGMLVGKG